MVLSGYGWWAHELTGGDRYESLSKWFYRVPDNLKSHKSIISEECRRRRSKAVGFGLVEETQFAKLPQENEEVIQCASEGRAGTSRLNRSPSTRSPPGGRRSTRSSSVLPDETTGERSSEEDIGLVASFTALRNALQDDKSP